LLCSANRKSCTCQDDLSPHPMACERSKDRIAKTSCTEERSQMAARSLEKGQLRGHRVNSISGSFCRSFEASVQPLIHCLHPCRRASRQATQRDLFPPPQHLGGREHLQVMQGPSKYPHSRAVTEQATGGDSLAGAAANFDPSQQPGGPKVPSRWEQNRGGPQPSEASPGLSSSLSTVREVRYSSPTGFRNRQQMVEREVQQSVQGVNSQS